jgi:chondroitin 4-sulfotransferase 11
MATMIWNLFRRERNVLFVWLPKTAGSSIYHALRKTRYKCRKLINTEKNGIIESPYTDFDNKGAVTFSHTSIDALIKNNIVHKEFIENAFKFCFVRNPWDRLVSLFFYRSLNKQYKDFKEFCLDFKDWEIEPIGLYNSRLNSQFNDQVSWLIDGKGRLLVDFIGRFERLEEDFSKICRILRVRNTLPHRNRSNHSGYRDYYDETTIEIVRNKCIRDIEFFGYDF